MRLLYTYLRISSGSLGLILALVLGNVAVSAQTQVANFATGKVNTGSYEHFSFYATNGARGEITYVYGKEGVSGAEIKANYLGTDTWRGMTGFKIGLLNNQVLLVVPQKTSLKIIDEKGKYNKIFRWEYEGPVDGRGTWCEQCTQSGKESVALLRKYFLQ